MFKCHEKFENLEDELVNLQDVLKNSLQNEVLTIKKLDKEGEKYKHISRNIQDLSKAEYVIFSKYMNKDFHHLEKFIFLDATGNTVCTLSGRELDLYNMIKDCDNLKEVKHY
jgi:hypothetical protein